MRQSIVSPRPKGKQGSRAMPVQHGSERIGAGQDYSQASGVWRSVVNRCDDGRLGCQLCEREVECRGDRLEH